MVVLSKVKPGQEDKFNRWYGVHMLETIEKLQGLTCGQRFELAAPPGAPCNSYLTVYEVEGGTSEDLRRAYEQFWWQRQERAGGATAGRDPVVSVSDTFDPDHFLVGFFSATIEKGSLGARRGAGVSGRLHMRIAAVVEGGSGMGRATGRRPAVEGAHVYVADLSKSVAGTVAREICEDGGSATDCPLGATDETTQAFFTVIDRLHGRLHVLHDQVGMPAPGGLDVSEEDFQRSNRRQREERRSTSPRWALSWSRPPTARARSR